MPWSSRVLGFLIIANIFQSGRPQLFGWSEDRQNKRLFEDVDFNESNSIEEESTSSQKPVLNIGDKDSPYALINTFFLDREAEHERRKDLFSIAHAQGKVPDPPKGIKPEEVWLSDGNLLVLKGGTSDGSLPPDQWEPLDDFVAPYREPKLPPPDFVPTDIGVGVPLSEDYNESTTTPPTTSTETSPLITTTPSPIIIKTLKPYLYNENDFIFDMENFHSIKRPVSTTASPIIYVTAPPSFEKDPPVATHLPILLRWKDPKSSSSSSLHNNEIEDDNNIVLRNKGKRIPLQRKRNFRRAPRIFNTGITRRSGERYVTFIGGAARGGRSWSYSYQY